jgi:hypothetical protein
LNLTIGYRFARGRKKVVSIKQGLGSSSLKILRRKNKEGYARIKETRVNVERAG